MLFARHARSRLTVGAGFVFELARKKIFRNNEKNLARSGKLCQIKEVKQQTNHMKPHPHAQLAQQYWKEAEVDSEAWRNWEYENGDGKWRPMKSTPLFSTDCQYRRRPRTIRIGEYDVPEPLREAPEIETKYWFVSFPRGEKVDYYTWGDDPVDRTLLQRGMIHLTEEAAKIHAEALISLTKA